MAKSTAYGTERGCVRAHACVCVCVVHSGLGTGFPALEMANHLFSPYGEAQSAAEGRGGMEGGR